MNPPRIAQKPVPTVRPEPTLQPKPSPTPNVAKPGIQPVRKLW
jgi:hypothetical protein